MDGVPPKFTPFKKLKVALALEPTPMPIDEKTDLTAFSPTPFRTGLGAVAGVADPSGAAGLAGGLSELPEELEMFAGRKRAKKAPATAKAPKEPIPEAIARIKAVTGAMAKAKSKAKASGTGKPTMYSRYDVEARTKQDALVTELSEDLQKDAKVLLDVERENPYIIDPPPDTFIPLTRRGFGKFLYDNYRPIFPTKEERKLDVATCAAKGDEGSKEVKIYHYQAFIREYLRYESPYRGLLVYHGLGSGKTCSAIAAAEALFGNRGMKVIVMTPYSLRDNFISEITFCGFKHFRLQNHWTAMSLLPGSIPEPRMVQMFAQGVYGIPESYFAKRPRSRPQLTRIWIPDFEEAPNYDTLSPEEKDEIQTQLKATIENRIKFINYNGILAKELKQMVCSTPDIFDNAVIVVDEIHNLTRLIQGTLEHPFTKAKPKETLTPDRTPLPQCGLMGKYTRGYLFYRLFMNARNCKIIGLSGTPLINFPEEMGIMMNIMHGAIQTIEFNVAVEAMRDVRAAIEKAVAADENIDTVFFTASEGSMTVMLSRLPEQFVKVFGIDPGSEEKGPLDAKSSGADILGIKRRDPLDPVPTLQQVWDTFSQTLRADKIVIKGTPSLKAQELLPTWDTLFRAAFLQEDGITLKNTSVLQKRIRGLVSYYRGIQGNVMPKVTKDEIIGVPLTGYALKMYNKVRNQEIQIEMSKPKADLAVADAIWAEIGELAQMKTSSNYRMASRQACNFAFPEGLSRPRPGTQEEQDVETGKDRDVIVEAEIEGKVAGKDEGDAGSVADEDDEEAQAQAQLAKAQPKLLVRGSKEAKEAYKRDIRLVKTKLREMGQTHLLLDGPGESNLKKYSPKFHAMLQKIMDLPGSSLVYSTFLEMEGLGIFGICMEANGFVPIEIVVGADGKLKFSDRTAASLAKGPKVKENRYIEFTGVGSKEQRGAAVNTFNARLDKMSPAMEKVLKDAGWENNFDGGLCRVFGITAAGAEGLSLKAVRGVHIMEPYWNSVRTQQVKGRAVRICSHMDLPLDQQNVEIYTYCTTIPDEAVVAQAVDKTVERSDRFSVKEAALLGVPIPDKMAPGEKVPEGLFLEAEKMPEPLVAPGAEGVTDGPVKFATNIVNEYRGFSNFAPSPIVMGGKRYKTVEHYYQAMKFTEDLGWQEAIRVAGDAKKAKQLGKSKDHKIRADWDSVREAVMLDGLRAKFQQNRGLLDLLKSTGSRPIVHASVNPYWGEGRTGKGKNRMGKLLEQVREELREYVVPEAVNDQAPLTEADFIDLEDEEEGENEDGGDGPVGGKDAEGSKLAEPGVSKREIKVGVNIENKYKALSNSALIPVIFTSVSGKFTYPSIDHLYQAMKYEGTDLAWQNRIRAAKTAEEARLLGMTPGHKKDPGFDGSIGGIITQALKLKFEDKALATLLASTGDKKIVEESSEEPELMQELIARVRRDLPDDELPALMDPQEGGALTGAEDEDDADTREFIITSDQKVLIISLRKERVINSLQTLMKTVAVDCTLNYEDNKDGTFKCLNLGDSVGSFAYHPDLQKDIQETEAAFKVKGAAAPLALAAPVAAPVPVPRPLAVVKPSVKPLAIAPPQVALKAPLALKVAEEEGAEGPVPAALPVAVPAVVPAAIPEKPRLKKFTYRKQDYRAVQKVDEATKAVLGYVVYDVNDLYGDSAPIGFVKSNPKGIPAGNIGPLP